jgi:hypothetical protein
MLNCDSIRHCFYRHGEHHVLADAIGPKPVPRCRGRAKMVEDGGQER